MNPFFPAQQLMFRLVSEPVVGDLIQQVVLLAFGLPLDCAVLFAASTLPQMIEADVGPDAIQVEKEHSKRKVSSFL
jgi:hypothetical protein